MTPPAALLRTGYGALRAIAPVLVWGRGARAVCIVSRHDDVRQVLLDDQTFAAPYAAKLRHVVGDAPFLLGMAAGSAYRDQLAALNAGVTAQDVAERLPQDAAATVARLIGDAREVEVVGLIRTAMAEVLGRWFGLAGLADAARVAALAEAARKLFVFQFADQGDDPALRAWVETNAAPLRAALTVRIAEAREGALPPDTLIARYVAAGALDDATLVAAMTGLIVGGLPQPPMVAPNALDQLLRRPEALAAAREAARARDAGALAALVFEAMRFDPLAPGLMRVVATDDAVIAPGAARARRLRKGARVIALFASAMFDHRRVADPQRFDAGRHASAYVHFGLGLHRCFAAALNRWLLPALLAPLLARPGLRRAPGERGVLRKEGLVFPTAMWVGL